MKTHKVVQVFSSDRKTVLQMKESTYKKIIDAVTKDKRIPGAKAIIRNTSAGGEVIIEGIATLKKELYHGRWIVRFPGDNRNVERFVQEEDVQ